MTEDATQQVDGQDVDALLDEGALPEKTHLVCLRADLIAQWEQLQEQFGEARMASSDMMVSGGRARKIAEQMESLRKLMRSKSLELRLRAHEPGGYRKLMRAHPPDKDDPIDRANGFHLDTFFPELIRRSTVSPAMTPGRWEKLFSKLSEGQLWDLGKACIDLNQESQGIPFSPLASQLIQGGENE